MGGCCCRIGSRPLADPKQVKYEGFLDGAGTLQNMLAPIEALEILRGGETITEENLSESFQGKLEAIRRMIAKKLSPYFDAKYLSPDSGALIYDTIDKVIKRRR